MKACASAHHWAREIAKFGHEVRLMPPAYGKPYVKRGKTDAADAEAIAEAVTRPTMRFVPVKTTDQQSALMLHKTRDLLVRQRTALINALRGHMGELGIVVPQGAQKVPGLVEALRAAGKEVLEVARCALDMLSISSASSISESKRPRRASSPGTEPTRRAGAWRRSQVLAQSRPAPSLPLCPTPASSARAASSQLG
jgi:transposase